MSYYMSPKQQRDLNLHATKEEHKPRDGLMTISCHGDKGQSSSPFDSVNIWCIVFFPLLKPLACGRQSRCLGWTYKLPGGQKFSIKLSALSVGFPQRSPLNLIKRPEFINSPGVRFINCQSMVGHDRCKRRKPTRVFPRGSWANSASTLVPTWSCHCSRRFSHPVRFRAFGRVVPRSAFSLVRMIARIPGSLQFLPTPTVSLIRRDLAGQEVESECAQNHSTKCRMYTRNIETTKTNQALLKSLTDVSHVAGSIMASWGRMQMESTDLE